MSDTDIKTLGEVESMQQWETNLQQENNLEWHVAVGKLNCNCNMKKNQEDISELKSH